MAQLRELALDNAACVQILRECGFFRDGAIRTVRLDAIPDGLSIAALMKYPRENGASIT